MFAASKAPAAAGQRRLVSGHHDGGSEDLDVVEPRVAFDGREQLALVALQVVRPLRVAGKVVLVGPFDGVHGARQLGRERRHLVSHARDVRRAHDEVGADAGGGQAVEALVLVRPSGDQPVAHVADPEVRERRAHTVGIGVWRAAVGQVDVDADGVRERGCAGRRPGRQSLVAPPMAAGRSQPVDEGHDRCEDRHGGGGPQGSSADTHEVTVPTTTRA
jgi:hypothetical protein